MINERSPGQERNAALTRTSGPPWGEGVFRRLLETLPAGAYMCDTDGLITYHNQRAVDLWGRSPRLNDPVDRFCGSFKLFATDGTPIRHDECWMALALRHNAEFNGREIIIERPDGSRLTALAHANPIRDEHGVLQGAVNVLVDISERKKAEDALREADRQKDEFLAMLAHELRNPLASITLASHILNQNPHHDPRTAQFHKIIHQQTQHLARLVDDLLDVSRITRGRVELEKRVVGLSELIRNVVDATRPAAVARQQQILTSFPDQAEGEDDLRVEADPARLSQIVTNLLHNAIKYTPSEGQIHVTVRREAECAVIRVRDTGIGISTDLLPRIFDLFTQEKRSPDRKEGGLGIGLALVRKLVELHEGCIEARSDGPGTGSEFIVRLPLSVGRLVEPLQDIPDAPAPSVLSTSVLLVEDREDTAQATAELLRLWGCSVILAFDGSTAIRLLRSVRPDVALLDIGLPEMDGYELARRIRNEPDTQDLMLIAVTGYGQPSDRIRALEAGFDHHLVKPMNLEELKRLLFSASGRTSKPAHTA